MTIVMTIGAPGSGKSTYAAKLQKEGYLNVAFDDLRIMMAGSKTHWWVRHGEDKSARAMLSDMYEAACNIACFRNRNVVLSGTNMHPGAERLFKKLTAAGRWVVIKFFDLTWEELLERDAGRDPFERVPHDALRSFYEQTQDPAAWWRPHMDCAYAERWSFDDDDEEIHRLAMVAL
jgi:adenylate kinase family enzyme